MKKILTTLLSAALLLAGTLCSAVTKSKTHFAEDALRPYVESGELAGAISILYKDGVQETCLFFTLCETCKNFGINFKEYIAYAAKELISGNADYESLAPWAIKLV